MIRRSIILHRNIVTTTGDTFAIEGKATLRDIKKACEERGVEYISHTDSVSIARYEMSDADFVAHATLIE